MIFVLRHVLALAAILLAAAGAGTLALGERRSLALRSAFGLALWAHALFFLALFGQLRLPIVAVLFVIATIGGAMRGRLIALHPRWLLAAPVFAMALLPPLAFDETLYHLPFIRATAASGELRFLADLRFPAFPRLHELLCVPVLLALGDVATHLVSFAEVLITVALLLEWGRRKGTGALAAALFAGGPIVVLLATVGYVDAALTLFVAASFFCREAEESLLAGFFAGTACGVKYLALFFHWGLTPIKGIAAAVVAAPTTLWLIGTTGNPVFPFFFGHTAWSFSLPQVDWQTRVVDTLRLAWDVTFARGRVNAQPPFTPFLIPALVAMRSRKTAVMVVAYAIAFAFLPRDSRYLVPLLPMIFIAVRAPRWRWLPWLAVAPGILYACWALATRGLPPTTPQGREAMLTARVPEYAAVQRAGTGTIYVCGGEQLKDYARGRLLGDFLGPYSYDRVKDPRSIGAEYFLVAKRVCPRRDAVEGMSLVYEDAGAQLWRVQGSTPSSR